MLILSWAFIFIKSGTCPLWTLRDPQKATIYNSGPPHVHYRTDEELDHIMNDFRGEDILDDEHIVID